MFVDQADVEVFAGDGGRGCVSMRKEKYIPLGGPDGGDGGDGGSVYLEATPGVDTLLDMTGRHHWKAQPGDNGMGKKMAGRDGEDLVIRVPPGTLAYDGTSGLLLADLKTPGTRVRMARGGRGGKGNVHFMNSVRQAPDFAEPGQKGEKRKLHLELRLIADVGIIGLPNAGKSTFLSRISHARPKIADYPFTTLVPQLGIAELDAERRLVVADIPGLIEGAHEGAGLGLDFLRHVERTRVLVHILDMLPLDGSSPVKNYRHICAELKAYSKKLAAKPEILLANKMDLTGASEALADLRQALPGKLIYAVSAVAGTGLRPLLEALWQQVKKAPESAPLVEEHPYVPPADTRDRSDEEKFQYIAAEANEDDWEGVEEEAMVPDTGKSFIDAAGEPVAPPKRRTRKEIRKAKRMTIEPVPPPRAAKQTSVRGRQSAKVRKAEHDARVTEQKAKAAAAVAPPPPDPDLAAEIAAIKADDKRKGKYYTRKKTDI